MSCRVGMSTDPDARIQYWKDKEGHTHATILASGLTYSQALAREREEAEAKGCEYHGGGQPVTGKVWSVYHVWGGR